MTQYTIVVRHGNHCQFVRVLAVSPSDAMTRAGQAHPEATGIEPA